MELLIKGVVVGLLFCSNWYQYVVFLYFSQSPNYILVLLLLLTYLDVQSLYPLLLLFNIIVSFLHLLPVFLDFVYALVQLPLEFVLLEGRVLLLRLELREASREDLVLLSQVRNEHLVLVQLLAFFVQLGLQ